MFQETGESVIHIKLLSAWRMSTSQAGSSVSRTGTTTVGRQRTSQVWNYFEYDAVQGKSVSSIESGHLFIRL